MTIVLPILIGVAYVLVNGLIPEPARRRANAIMVGGAGAAYLSGGGLGAWELVFTAVVAYVAYRGLESWTFIGLAWLLHTAWDVVHHLRGEPIIPFADHSSLGCAICDPVIAIWCLAGGPSLLETIRSTFRTATHNGRPPHQTPQPEPAVPSAHTSPPQPPPTAAP